VLRHRGRSLLAVAMVGLPVLAVVGADTLYRTRDISPMEALPATLGAANARLTGETHAAGLRRPGHRKRPRHPGRRRAGRAAGHSARP